MSWLLAASVPGLLMMATFGLERLESAIEDRDADCSVREDEVAELIERAVPEPRTNGARTAVLAAPVSLDDEPDLPTRVCRSLNGNPQFQPTRQANRV